MITPQTLRGEAPPVPVSYQGWGEELSDPSYTITPQILAMEECSDGRTSIEVLGALPSLRILSKGFCRKNYAPFLRTLLQVEEGYDLFYSTLRWAPPPSMAVERGLDKEGGPVWLRVDVPGLWEDRPRLGYGDVVLIRPHEAKEEFVTSVWSVERNPREVERQGGCPFAVISADASFRDKYGVDKPTGPSWRRTYPAVIGNSFHVRFKVRRQRFGAMHSSLSMVHRAFLSDSGIDLCLPDASIPVDAHPALEQAPSQDPMSVPSRPSSLQPSSSHPSAPPRSEYVPLDDCLNEEQASAAWAFVARTASCMSAGSEGRRNIAPLIVFGPPGTGKTLTAIESARQVLRHFPRESRILFTCPSNSAADIVCDRLSEFCEPMGAESPQKPIMLRLCHYKRDIRFLGFPRVRQFHLIGPDGIYGAPELEDLLKVNVVVCTCVCAHILAARGVPPGHFTHLIMDEAGQALEPEVLVPVSLASIRTLVMLIGDPFQLGPVVRSPLCRAMSLGVSLLERLMNQTPDDWGAPPEEILSDSSRLAVVRLRRQYRGHPVLLQTSSNLFYGGKLLCFADEVVTTSLLSLPFLPAANLPLYFHGVEGTDLRDEASVSFHNPDEAAVVVETCASLSSNGVELASIGVISPFRRQVVVLRKALRERGMGDVRVGTVEDYQGQQQIAIVISAVRSSERWLSLDRRHGLGIHFQSKRFNVAMSRAQALMVVVGNPFLLQLDPNWRMLLRLCLERGAYKGCRFDPAILLKEPKQVSTAHPVAVEDDFNMDFSWMDDE